MSPVIESASDSSTEASASPTASIASSALTPPISTEGKRIFGQPRGLATLFLTEMWERFSFYGTRAILILFMTAAITRGGLGIADKTASSIYGLYLAGAYLSGLAGGWIADRLIGAQRAVFSGGVVIMVGNAMLASGNTQVFFIGLLVTMLGVGLLKPNISAIVGRLYPEGGSRRDAGFSIFYMGINVGSALGSLLVPWCAQYFGWHMGLALPAAGMLFGLVQFVATRHYLGAHGAARESDAKPGSWTPVVILALVIAALIPNVDGCMSCSPCSSAAPCSGPATSRWAPHSTCSQTATPIAA
jgi:POT family proton-dependent oligopeptide transporter